MQPSPLKPALVPEVDLPRAPLTRVVAQVRFPTILAIRDPDRTAEFQERLRRDYPYLARDEVHRVELGASQTPKVDRHIVWRLADREEDPEWQVSLGVDFAAVETTRYAGRGNFLDRLRAVMAAVEAAFTPADFQRFGLRYVNRLTGEAAQRAGELLQPGILGVMSPAGGTALDLGNSVVRSMTEAQFDVRGGCHMLARWGKLPGNVTYDPDAIEPVTRPSWILDLDMFTLKPQPFQEETLHDMAKNFAEGIYWLFRKMVTEEFLKFHGGRP